MRTSLRSASALSIALVLSTASTAFAQGETTQPAGPTARKAPADEPAASEQRGASKETFRVGPLVGLSYPRPLALGGMIKIRRVVAIGAEYGFLPRATLGSTSVAFQGIAADLRVFPFKNAFFVGVRGGRQWLDASTTLSAAQLGAVTETAAASTWFVNPRIGVLKTWDSGITVGVDAGVQVPIAPTYERSGPAAAAGLSTGMDEAMLTVAKALGNQTIPTIDLLRVGFLF